MDRKRIMLILLFISLNIFDGGIIVYATLNKITWLLYLMVIFGLVGAFILFRVWNKDERTDRAIDEASRITIAIFLIIIIAVGSLFIILSSFQSSILWEIGAVLIIAALVLIYLQAIMSTYYEGKMS
jgi:uncharacterized membrane protein